MVEESSTEGDVIFRSDTGWSKRPTAGDKKPIPIKKSQTSVKVYTPQFVDKLIDRTDDVLELLELACMLEGIYNTLVINEEKINALTQHGKTRYSELLRKILKIKSEYEKCFDKIELKIGEKIKKVCTKNHYLIPILSEGKIVDYIDPQEAKPEELYNLFLQRENQNEKKINLITYFINSIVKARKSRDPRMRFVLVGPPACGKTKFVFVLKEILGAKLIRTTASPRLDTDELIGDYTIADDKVVFDSRGLGYALQESQKGLVIYFIDEANLLRPEVLHSLTDALDHRVEVAYAGGKETIKGNFKNFIFFMAFNPETRTDLHRAIADRMVDIISFPQLSGKMVAEIAARMAESEEDNLKLKIAREPMAYELPIVGKVVVPSITDVIAKIYDKFMSVLRSEGASMHLPHDALQRIPSPRFFKDFIDKVVAGIPPIEALSNMLDRIVGNAPLDPEEYESWMLLREKLLDAAKMCFPAPVKTEDGAVIFDPEANSHEWAVKTVEVKGADELLEELGIPVDEIDREVDALKKKLSSHQFSQSSQSPQQSVKKVSFNIRGSQRYGSGAYFYNPVVYDSIDLDPILKSNSKNEVEYSIKDGNIETTVKINFKDGVIEHKCEDVEKYHCCKHIFAALTQAVSDGLLSYKDPTVCKNVATLWNTRNKLRKNKLSSEDFRKLLKNSKTLDAEYTQYVDFMKHLVDRVKVIAKGFKIIYS